MTVEVRAQPRARRTSVELRDGVLKVAVTVPPEDGKANSAIVALLAETWHLPKSAFAVVKGATTRNKTIGVTGDPVRLAGLIEGWIRDHAGEQG